VLNVALKHDKQLANRFLQTLEENVQPAQDTRGAFDDRSARSEQLLRLALQAIESEPTVALTYAERSLQDGVSFNLQIVLLRLRLKNRDLANRLFDAALQRLSNSSAAISEIQVLASYLFRPGQVVAPLSDGAMTVAVVQGNLPDQTPAQADPARARIFLSVVQRIILSQPLPVDENTTTARDVVLLADSLAQPYQMYGADLWPGIASRRAQFALLLPPAAASSNSGVTEKVREAARSGASAEVVSRLRVDALQEAAEKEANPIARKLKFAEAALATAAKDFERGKTLADRIDNDEELRKQVIIFLYYRAALSFFNENSLDKAEETALKIPMSAERAVAVLAVAQTLASSTSRTPDDDWTTQMLHQHATELLFETDKSLKNQLASITVAKIRLGKIAISHLLDGSQAFADFEQAIAVINRLDYFDPNDEATPRLGIEGLAAARETLPRVSVGFGFRGALAPLIKQDFDRTIATVDSLSSPSIRGMCRLQLARQALDYFSRPQRSRVTAITIADSKKH
jgi:hypothetical protein